MTCEFFGHKVGVDDFNGFHSLKIGFVCPKIFGDFPYNQSLWPGDVFSPSNPRKGLDFLEIYGFHLRDANYSLDFRGNPKAKPSFSAVGGVWSHPTRGTYLEPVCACRQANRSMCACVFLSVVFLFPPRNDLTFQVLLNYSPNFAWILVQQIKALMFFATSRGVDFRLGIIMSNRWVFFSC